MNERNDKRYNTYGIEGDVITCKETINQALFGGIGFMALFAMLLFCL